MHFENPENLKAAKDAQKLINQFLALYVDSPEYKTKFGTTELVVLDVENQDYKTAQYILGKARSLCTVRSEFEMDAAANTGDVKAVDAAGAKFEPYEEAMRVFSHAIVREQVAATQPSKQQRLRMS